VVSSPFVVSQNAEHTRITVGKGCATRQLQSVSYSKSGTPLFGQSYTYGSSGANNGEMTAITDSVDTGRNMTYIYDSLDRLSKSTSQGSTSYPAWGLSFTYDRYGNRTAQSISSGCTGLTCPTSSVTVSATTNQLTGSPYTNDVNGNTTNDGVNAMTYDAENRVVSAADGSGTATYAYDGLGHRVQKTFSGTTTTYVFAGNDVLSEYAGGTLTNEYIRQGRTLVAEYNGGTLTYHGRDPLSVRLNMDATGNTSGQQGHFPFGENWYNTNSTTKWHFTAYERDPESSNDHATFRYHVNRLGRFSSVDPVRPRGPQPQSLNRYTYVASDPINRKDRDGLMPNFPYGIPVDEDGCPYESELDLWMDYRITPWEFESDYPGCPTDGGGGGGGGGVGCSDGANCGGEGGGLPPPPATPVCSCVLFFGINRGWTGCSYACSCPGPTGEVFATAYKKCSIADVYAKTPCPEDTTWTVGPGGVGGPGSLLTPRFFCGPPMLPPAPKH
jgi:RHS repeat-associated protein